MTSSHAVTVPPSAMDFDALSTQQAFASSLTAAAVGHNLAMIADQCSLLLLTLRLAPPPHSRLYPDHADSDPVQSHNSPASRLSVFCFLPPCPIALGTTTRFLTPSFTSSRCNQ